jgi:Alpha amylase, catalytic domain
MQQCEELLRKTAELVNARRRLPEATYRLQFHAGFTFRDAIPMVAYLRDLGITHVYASPYLKARPGSTHGYDITDHQLLNPEIGTEEDYAVWVKALRDHGLGQILDMVPNHMGIIGNENRPLRLPATISTSAGTPHRGRNSKSESSFPFSATPTAKHWRRVSSASASRAAPLAFVISSIVSPSTRAPMR